MRGNPDARQGAIALHGFYFLYYGLQGVSIPFFRCGSPAADSIRR
ncbi:hypothetical protein WJ967_19115 [Achromobacter xylosoxidans]